MRKEGDNLQPLKIIFNNWIKLLSSQFPKKFLIEQYIYDLIMPSRKCLELCSTYIYTQREHRKCLELCRVDILASSQDQDE